MYIRRVFFFGKQWWSKIFLKGTFLCSPLFMWKWGHDIYIFFFRYLKHSEIRNWCGGARECQKKFNVLIFSPHFVKLFLSRHWILSHYLGKHFAKSRFFRVNTFVNCKKNLKMSFRKFFKFLCVRVDCRHKFFT